MSAGLIVLIILGVLVLLGFGTCAVVIGVAASAAKKTADLALTPKVSVTCDGNPAKGFECNVTQISGATGANVCWDVHVSCENGAQVDGHACQAVHIGSKASRFVSAAEMTHTKTCNRAQSTAVLNVIATPM
jgi:hypothetical protein